MEKTLKDYILECDLYPYSKENFDLMKECAEIDLMARYLENVEFIESGYGSEIKDAGYFQESVSETEYQAMTESLQEKVKNVGNKVKTLVGKIINMLKTALGAVVKAFNKIKEKAARLFNGDTYSAGQFDAPGVKAIEMTIREAWDIRVDPNSDVTFKEIAKIPAKQKMHYEINAPRAAFIGIDKSSLRAAVDAVINYAHGGEAAIIPLNKAVDPHHIISIAKDAIDGKAIDDASAEKILKHNGRTVIYLSADNIVEDLDSLQGDLSSKVQASSTNAGETDTASNAKIISALMESTSDTIKLLNGWSLFSRKVIDAITGGEIKPKSNVTPQSA